MNRQEIRDRARFLYWDELQYALAREERVDTEVVRERSTLRHTREMQGQEATHLFELLRGIHDLVARRVDRDVVIDFDNQQLGFNKAIRIGDNTLVPVDRARLRDWLAFDEIRERAFQQHAAKREHEREEIAAIIERLQTHGDDATTFEVCPDLFTDEAEEAA